MQGHQLFSRFKKRLISKAVLRSVVYPKAMSIPKPSLNEITVDKLTSDTIKSKLNEEYSTMDCRDVSAFVDHYSLIVEIIKEEAPNGGLCFIQIHNSGIYILRIHLMGYEHHELAAFIDMNEFKKQYAKDRNIKLFLSAAIGSTLYAIYKLCQNTI